MRRFNWVVCLILCVIMLCSCTENKSAGSTDGTAGGHSESSNTVFAGCGDGEIIVTPSHAEDTEKSELNSTEKNKARVSSKQNTYDSGKEVSSVKTESKKPNVYSESNYREEQTSSAVHENLIPSDTEVAEKIILHINELREKEGAEKLIVLPGLTKVAEYRSSQLVKNFSHSTKDMREAAAYYKYGKYVDMTLFGFDETYNYYDYEGMEAISKGGWTGTADQIGEQAAEAFKKSGGHWRYVGDNSNKYIAVGVTYNADTAYNRYVCVIVSETDIYE